MSYSYDDIQCFVEDEEEEPEEYMDYIFNKNEMPESNIKFFEIK